MAKRGMTVECLHFHSYPYTNEQAKEKVVELTRILSRYAGTAKLRTVKVTHIQEEIHKNCNGAYMVTLLRRFMMRLAERLALCHEISLREGAVPGTHTVAYTSDDDVITLRHELKSRRALALGAVVAAEFLVGKHGVYTMDDLLK